MCIAVVKPAGVDISEETIYNCWKSNADGAGIAYIRKKKVVIDKGYMKLDKFMEAWQNLSKRYPKSPFLLHFRIRSTGSINEGQTHPFPIKNGAMIHNGTISGTGALYNGPKSDTELFAERFGSVLTLDFLKKHKDKIDSALGYNKLAFLFDSGEYVIINESIGVWSNGIWYSNRTFEGNKSWSRS